MATLFLLAWVTLDLAQVPTVSLVLMGMVFIVTRYGQIGASVGRVHLRPGRARSTRSARLRRPPILNGWQPFEAGITLQLFMLMMMATSLPLAALLMQHDRLALRLKARNARMRENLLLLNMAEEVARIGRWRYDPRSGEQDWSRQMFLINGLDPGLGRDPGDIKALLPDGGSELFGQLAHHAKDRARYSFEYRIRPPNGDERTLKMYATNEFAESGELATMFGVVMDVTEHHQRQEALDKERTRAMRLAAEAQYLAHTDPLTGLANRRRAITQLEKCVRRSEQDGRPMALISFDIDHFKRVNDTKGHQTGDDVLVRISDIARAQARAKRFDRADGRRGIRLAAAGRGAGRDQGRRRAPAPCDRAGKRRGRAARRSPPASAMCCGARATMPMRCSRGWMPRSTKPRKPGGTRSRKRPEFRSWRLRAGMPISGRWTWRLTGIMSLPSSKECRATACCWRLWRPC